MGKTSVLVVLALAVSSITSDAAAGWKFNALVAGAGILTQQLARTCVKSQACRAEGTELAVEAATGLVERYGPVMIAKCTSSPSCFNSQMAAIATGAAAIPALTPPSVEPGPGEGMTPPGDCGPGELAKYSAAVETFCKNERPNKCDASDDEITLIKKVAILQQCLSARSKRETQCFRGGNRSHRTEIENTKNQMSNCYKRLAKQQ